MALSAWQATIVNESGDVIPSASIEVTNEATGLTATIYANAGGGSLGNPFSAGTNGFARFYADAGSYTITASDAGSGFSESFNNVRLGNAQGYDVGSGAGEIPRNSDLPTLGTAAIKNVGTAPDEVPTNAILSTSVLAPDGDGSQLTGLPAGYTDADALSLFNASGSAPVYACRAWVNFNGTGTVAIRASGNVSSVADNGIGNYTVNFITAMVDANYNITMGFKRSSGSSAGSIGVKSTSTPSVNEFSIITFDSSNSVADMNAVYLSVHR